MSSLLLLSLLSCCVLAVAYLWVDQCKVSYKGEKLFVRHLYETNTNSAILLWMVHTWEGGQQGRKEEEKGAGKKMRGGQEKIETSLATNVYTHSFLLPLAGLCGDPNRHFLAKHGDVLLGINLHKKKIQERAWISTIQNWSSNSHWPVIVILLRRRSEWWFCKLWRRFQWRERTTRGLCKQNTHHYSKIVSSVEHLRFRNVSTHTHCLTPSTVVNNRSA